MYNIKELREMAVSRGIKMSSRMNTITLCNKLNIPHVKNEKFEAYHRHTIRCPVPIIFICQSEDSIIEFPSIYNAAKNIGKNCSCIPFYIQRKSVINYKGKWYTVQRAKRKDNLPYRNEKK